MDYSMEPIVRALKAARQEKGLSQRELSARAGVPQGHISKIENGAVDLKLSSLIALARVLDLEVMPVPRRLVPAVEALARTGQATDARNAETARLAAKQVKRLDKAATRVAADRPANGGKFARLRRAARELVRFSLGPKELDSLRMAVDAVRRLEQGQAHGKEIEDAAAGLESARDRLAHRAAQEPVQPPRPAYSLADGDDDA